MPSLPALSSILPKPLRASSPISGWLAAHVFVGRSNGHVQHRHLPWIVMSRVGPGRYAPWLRCQFNRFKTKLLTKSAAVTCYSFTRRIEAEHSRHSALSRVRDTE
jgi:hypothetical protein